MFERVYFIAVSWAVSVVDIVFKKLTNDENEKLKRTFIQNGVNLKGEKTTNLKEALIDSAKVLRVLLEYYRWEKKVRYYILEKLFEEQKEI